MRSGRTIGTTTTTDNGGWGEFGTFKSLMGKDGESMIMRNPEIAQAPTRQPRPTRCPEVGEARLGVRLDPETEALVDQLLPAGPPEALPHSG